MYPVAPPSCEPLWRTFPQSAFLTFLRSDQLSRFLLKRRTSDCHSTLIIRPKPEMGFAGADCGGKGAARAGESSLALGASAEAGTGISGCCSSMARKLAAN